MPLDTVLLLAGVAFGAGFIDAIAGGGGLLTVPALLAAGVPPHIALGTNKLSSTFGSSIAAYTFVRKGLFTPRRWRPGAVATLVGAVLGTLLTHAFSPGALKTLVPLVVLAAALYLVWPWRSRPAPAAADYRPPAAVQGRWGLAIGTYDGFIGPGTGAFWTAVALSSFRQDILHAAGTARFMNFVSNITSLVAFALLGAIDYRLGLAMGSSLMVGAWLGAHSAIRFGSPLIRPLFMVVVMAMAARLLWQQFAG